MTWRKYESHKEETAAVKAALKAAGINAEVGHGTGTAWAWLEINVGKGPHVHDIGDHRSCNFCDRRWEQIVHRALKIALEVTGRTGPYNGEINILSQDSWSKKQGSYAIEQTMDNEERNSHPELCKTRDNDSDLHATNAKRKEEPNKTETVNQQNNTHNTVRAPAEIESDAKQYLPTNTEQKIVTGQNEKTYTGDFAYRLESRRVADTDFPYAGQTINNSKSAADFVSSVLKDADAEKMIVLYLNNQNKVIGVTYNAGATNACSVYPQQIAKTALLAGASGVILVHNHPSGGLVPSIEDKRLTYNTITGMTYIGIEVHDHIIYAGPSKYYSMADTGLIAQYKQKITENQQQAQTLYEKPAEEVKQSYHRHR
jgi:DNA repair protein RadC